MEGGWKACRWRQGRTGDCVLGEEGGGASGETTLQWPATVGSTS